MNLTDRLNKWIYENLIPADTLKDIDRYIIVEERERMKQEYAAGKIIDFLLYVVIIGTFIAIIIFGIKDK